jgi:hypothetical protein
MQGVRVTEITAGVHPSYEKLVCRIASLEHGTIQPNGSALAARRAFDLVQRADERWKRTGDDSFFQLCFMTVFGEGAFQIEWESVDHAVELEIPAEGPVSLLIRRGQSAWEESFDAPGDSLLDAIRTQLGS